MYIVICSMHIGVGSGLLVLTVMGNLRASIRGASNDKSPRFLYLGGSRINLMLNTIWRRSVCVKTMLNQIMLLL